ncbi:MAG: pyridoxal phosphate-dependent aminotransferase [Roseibium sp.]|uniref:pyridoxal phosphate-dependent aminotransferase n=1 Tax=Roseibium sp. TaxID=1936156 RepID=UPI001B1FECF8|nr:pyridoxal phosphate-dependent aminotransferase [Roseibium sp.]MBO6894813.1 pyridoxal phosphate-dependent aminotransferase [Roseibium sp.]MBO6930386.1 pyridoxal phosphate-dependent aminotransferase [Roseibium sp.]
MGRQFEFRRAERISGIALSEIVQISEKARQLRSDGRDIISLSTGEPDFPTPRHVIEAAHKAALEGQTKYPPTAGTAALRDAIAADAGGERENVIVSTGAKQVLANAMLATLNAGDEVVIPAPFWTSYSDIVGMAGGVPVTVSCPMSDGFKLTPAKLEAAITPKTRWVMLNSPSNPSGAIYTAEEIEALANVLVRHPDVWVLSDEIYEHLSFEEFTSFVDAAPALRQRTLIVNGVSKAWAMTGWRLGWGIGPADLVRAMTAVQGQVTSGACAISQAAALAALNGCQDLLAERRQNFHERRDFVVACLNTMPGVNCPVPDGAFYVFPDIAELIEAGRFANDAAVCDWLLTEAQVAMVPGRAFGLSGHARISFAYARADLERGMDRMAAAIGRLKS